MKRFNKLLIGCIAILLIIILFVDKNTLDSLMMHYDDVVVNEVAVLNIDYNKVVYSEDAVKPGTSVVSSVKSTTANQNVSNNTAVNKWVWPTERDYVITTYFSGSHNALDIYSYKGNGSSIFAANSGTVTSVHGGCVPGNISCNGKGGNYIVIKHNVGNYYTVYMHLKTINVHVGDVVSSGQVIGTMGNTGNVIPVPTSSNPHGGTHLHFCLYVGEPFRGGYAVNPLNMY